MKISVEKLNEIISRLPDPKTYRNNEYHAVILEPIVFSAREGQIPTKGHGKELIFKKEFINGKYEWFLEY